MAAPANPAEFLELVRKSGVVDISRLDNYVAANKGKLPSELGKLAGVLVRDGILTHFQAEQFLLGKWRRFTIGKYKVLERLGSGGMGSVYLCEHRFMRRRVAVKVLPAAKADDPAALERFYREARAVAALDHPNIVRAYDIDQDDKLHFLVMEYVDGASLQEIVKKHGPMDINRAAHYIQQAAVGLQHAYQTAGIVHRDIKPGNLLVDRTGVVKILDMGLARFFHDEEDLLTKKYDENVLGTADYLAPEQALDSHSVDIRADIYSLGATFYFLLTGNTPFTEGTVAQKLIWHQTKNPKPIKSLRPEVPEKLVAVVEKMMAKKPEDRYQTPAEVVQALSPWTQKPIPPPPEKEMPRLSPAALGDTSLGISSPEHPTAPMPAPTPTPTGGAAVAAVAPRPTTTRPTPAPAISAGNGKTAIQEAPNWSDIAPDSQRDSSLPLPQLVIKYPFLKTFYDHRPFWLIVSAAGSVFFMSLFMVWWALSGTRPPEPNRPPSPNRVLRVNDSGDEGTFRTLHEALAKAAPKTRILIEKDFLEETLVVPAIPADRLQGISIESGLEKGKRVVWACPSKAKDFIKISNVEDGLVIKGFEIDGKDQIDNLIVLTQRCQNIVLEDLHLTGFKEAGIQLFNCYGTKEQPNVIHNVRITANSSSSVANNKNKVAVSLRSISSMPANDSFTFENCRFEGPFAAAVEVNGNTRNGTFRHCRIFDAKYGFHYKRAIPYHQVQLNVESSTFCKNETGFFFEVNPPKESKLTIKNNLFYKVGVLAQAEERPGNHQPGKVDAQWIWFNEPGDLLKNAPKETRFFRKTFKIASSKPIANANLNFAVSDNDEISVWVNGKAIATNLRGTKHVYFADVAPWLKSNADNVIAIRAKNAWNGAGVLCQLDCTFAGDKPLHLHSDGSWKATKNANGVDWTKVDFKEDGWQGAKTLKPYNDGKVPWKNLTWDIVVQGEFGKIYKDILTTEGNVRGPLSIEGGLSLASRFVEFPDLPTNPNKPDFLVYPANGPLGKLNAGFVP
ncbi:MAG: hypothetical protein KatS3mg105_3996 [Gemmatales bacterium]|nr:MAG: hypothetical protein KatS3mg105_3996 [Gemmatales bacterium]